MKSISCAALLRLRDISQMFELFSVKIYGFVRIF